MVSSTTAIEINRCKNNATASKMKAAGIEKEDAVGKISCKSKLPLSNKANMEINDNATDVIMIL
jgi:hypothetical protein